MQELSIVLPVYNEKDTIESVLKEWQEELDKQVPRHVFIICEDGSTDGTGELLKTLKSRYPLILNQKDKRRGYGQAVLAGITTANSPYILCIDSDGQCDPRDFKQFWKARDEKQVLIGWRKVRADGMQRQLLSGIFKSVFTFLFPVAVHDPSAPFVLFKKKSIIPYLYHLRHLKEGFWWGFVGMCVKEKLSIHEIPIYHRNRLNGHTRVYTPAKIPSIAIRNLIGLVTLRLER